MAVTSLIIKLGAQVSGALSGIKSVYGSIDGLTQKITGMAAFKLGSLIGFATAGAGISGVGLKVLTLGARAETTRLSFQTMLGSVQKGDAMMAKLDKFSNATPYSGDQVNRSAKTLLAFGVAAGAVEGEMRKIGDAAAGTGKDFNDLTAIYGKVFAKGKADNEDLNQMIEAGIPILKVLGELYNKTGGEIQEMAAKGQISAADISKAFSKMSGEGGVFAGLMDKQSRTQAGMWGAIIGQLEYAASLIGEAIGPLVKDVLSYFQGWADELVAMSQDGRMVEYISTIAMTAVNMGATISKVVYGAWVYGSAAFQALGDLGAAVWDGVQGSAIVAFVSIVKWVNVAWEQTKAAFTVIGRIASATWDAFLAGVSSLAAKVVNIVLAAVNSVISMLNKIPGVDIDTVAKPAFVDKMEKFAAEAGARASKEMAAVAEGKDFKDSDKKAADKNKQWSGAEDQGNALIGKSADNMLGAVGRFADATKNAESGFKAIDAFAEKTNDKIAQWQLETQQKQAERRNDKLDMQQGDAANAANKAPKLKSDKFAVDAMTKIGAYNFGPNQVRSIDKERNNLLTQIRDTLGQINKNGGGSLA